MFRRVTATLLLALVLLCQPMGLVKASLVTARSEKDVVVVLWDPPKPYVNYFIRPRFAKVYPANSNHVGYVFLS